MDTSKLRQKIVAGLSRREKTVHVMLEVRGLVKGGFYRTRLKCGKKGCKCGRGELHEAWMFYRSEKGKTIIRAMSPREVSVYKRDTDNYKRYRRGRAELVKLSKEELRLVDLLEKALGKERRKIEQKLLRRRR